MLVEGLAATGSYYCPQSFRVNNPWRLTMTYSCTIDIGDKYSWIDKLSPSNYSLKSIELTMGLSNTQLYYRYIQVSRKRLAITSNHYW
jgi:hypothetical protein